MFCKLCRSSNSIHSILSRRMTFVAKPSKFQGLPTEETMNQDRAEVLDEKGRLITPKKREDSIYYEVIEETAEELEARKQRATFREEVRSQERKRLHGLKSKELEHTTLQFTELLRNQQLENNHQKRLEYAARLFTKPRTHSSPLADQNKMIAVVPEAIAPKSMKEALEIQKVIIDKNLMNKPVRGWKLGITNIKARQEKHMEHPFLGVMFDTYPSGHKFDFETELNPYLPAAECEFAFEVGIPFEAGKTYSKHQVLQHIRGIRPVIEIVGPRVEAINIKKYGIPLQMADCGGNIALIYGTQLFEYDHNKIKQVQASLIFDEKIAAKGDWLQVTGDQNMVLLDLVHWSVNYLTHHGISLQSGELISSGTMTGKTFMHDANQTIVADFGPLFGKIQFST